MPIWKQIALSLYYYASCPFCRAVHNGRLAATGRAPIIVLMYHRVADDAANPWTTSNDVFASQIDWLGERFEFVSLAEVQQRVAPGNDRPVVSITFDDGYAENCQRALPLLLRHKIPLTYFVTSSAVLRGRYFPHDLAMGNRLVPNTLAELKDLAAEGVEIGAHTRTHPDLGSVHDEAQLYDEIVTSGRELEDALGRPVRYFAFPFGQHRNLNGRGFELAASAGYEAVVSAYGGYNFCGDDPFHIQRIGVDGPLLRMKNWATFDPYKQWKTSRYDYAEDARARAGAGVHSA